MARNPLEYRAFEYDAMHGVYIEEAERLKGQGLKPFVYEIKMQKSVSATAVEFITNNTAYVVQASGAADTFSVVSTSTDDKSAAAGCVQALKVWGIDSTKNYRVVSTSTSGVTSASSSTTMFELNTFYSGQFGTSTQNCKGSCKVALAGKVSQAVLTIKAGQNHSECARVWMPPGWRGKINALHAVFADHTDANCSIYPNYYDAYENKQYDGSHDKIGFSDWGINLKGSAFPRIYGNDTTMGKITFFGVLGAAGAATINLAVRILLWAEPTAIASTQYKDILGV